MLAPSVFPPADYHHSYTFFYLHRDFRTFCVWIAVAAFTANFLPRSTRLERWPRVKLGYEFLIDLWATLACNWRAELPSLQAGWMGFRARRREAREAAERDCEEA